MLGGGEIALNDDRILARMFNRMRPEDLLVVLESWAVDVEALPQGVNKKALTAHLLAHVFVRAGSRFLPLARARGDARC